MPAWAAAAMPVAPSRPARPRCAPTRATADFQAAPAAGRGGGGRARGRGGGRGGRSDGPAVDWRRRAPTPDGRGPGRGRGRGRGGSEASFPPPFVVLPPPRAWRLFNVSVPVDADAGKDDGVTVCDGLADAASARLGNAGQALRLDPASITVVRKSFDARKGPHPPRFSYVVDVDGAAVTAGGVTKVREVAGRTERAPDDPPPGPLLPRAGAAAGAPPARTAIVVGGGPCGLFAALALAGAGVKPILLERGRAVEHRGRDIGALYVRSLLDPESNISYGEGGAGTWSDGKLTTRIGRNAGDVRAVLATLAAAGAPQSTLTSGKPHLGTDRLVRILANLRQSLLDAGGEVRFSARVVALTTSGGGTATGVTLADGTTLTAPAIVMAPGHSARDTYAALADAGAALEAKPCAVGFRHEAPQSLIDVARYGELAEAVGRGKGPVPVADYQLATQVVVRAQAGEKGSAARDVYSFCMCPGGQVVPTSTSTDELCVNGMSFSARGSPWANAALVVGVGPADWAHLTPAHGPLAGVEFQREIERAAAAAGGGALKCPVQRVDDFLEGASTPRAVADLPRSSYRLGVTSADLTTLYPPSITAALKGAIARFDRDLPGFASSASLLHGVETRTSAPVRIVRNESTGQCVNMGGLFPAGEGAGYAGGIVSAAVDGARAAAKVVAALRAG